MRLIENKGWNLQWSEKADSIEISFGLRRKRRSKRGIMRKLLSSSSSLCEGAKLGWEGVSEFGDGDGDGGGEQYNRISAPWLNDVEILRRGSRVDDHRGAGFGIGSAAPSFDNKLRSVSMNPWRKGDSLVSKPLVGRRGWLLKVMEAPQWF